MSLGTRVSKLEARRVHVDGEIPDWAMEVAENVQRKVAGILEAHGYLSEVRSGDVELTARELALSYGSREEAELGGKYSRPNPTEGALLESLRKCVEVNRAQD